MQFRRIFDPRLTEEYQVTGEPWSRQTGDGEHLAMAIGASLWCTGTQTSDRVPDHENAAYRMPVWLSKLEMESPKFNL
jgi:hypothetical protein